MNEWMKYPHLPAFLWLSAAKQSNEGRPQTCADEPTRYPYWVTCSRHVHVFCPSLKLNLAAPNWHIHKCLQGLLKTMSFIRVLRRGGYIEATACATEANSLQAGLMERAVRCCCRRDSWPCPPIEDLYFPPYFHSWTLAWLCYRKSPNGPLRERTTTVPGPGLCPLLSHLPCPPRFTLWLL